MKFPGSILAMAVLAAAPAFATDTPAPAAAQSESLLTMRGDGEIAIAANGKPLDYRSASPLVPELKQLIARAVPAWSFWPVLVDGKAVAARTKMRITLAAQPLANGYSVRVDNVTFRDDTAADAQSGASVDEVEIAARSMRLPKSPRGLHYPSAEAMVLLHLKLTPQGTVEQAFAAQSSLFNVRDRPELMDRALKVLEEHSMRAARGWTFDVDSKGKVADADDLTVVVPMVYQMLGGGTDVAGQWRQEARNRLRMTPWLRDTRLAQRIGVSDVDAGEVVDNITSPFKLRDGVIGNAL